ncbi:serine protease [Novosphingobium endophyticum]|uniref:Serine protease n=1 Tax=Novosphingobium endophyticum TaxID=1955250 RepID=A0A916TR64_9SPHN|nr:nodulation protein NfeD [Novosphingobium endophyticum]GGB97048.1 serine protease [Novosphingobium endophyticum]
MSDEVTRGIALCWRLALCLLLALVPLSQASAQGEVKQAPKTAYLLQIDGAIGPASASYIDHGMNRARDEGAHLIILEIDTPGGLSTSMREIIKDLLASPVPVVTYVHPSGARAASAGTYILYASHVAAMTPGTNLGAATPIQIGTMPAGPGEDKGKEKEDETKAQGSAAEKKAVNDAVAFIRSLAEMRGRNAEWAEEAVREGASLPADAALKQDVIDIVAADMTSLLRQLNGKEVTINGANYRIDTTGIALTRLEPSWTNRLLAAITDPNVALILMMIGIYGLIFEFMNPGALVPGTVGAISLLLALYALAALPVDMAGLALVLLGVALMVGEAFVPSFGALGIGGLVAFLLGATILFDTDVPEFRVDWSVIAALGLFSLAFLVLAGRLGLRSLRQRVVTGREEIVGCTGTVLDWKDGQGHVFVRSERWNAAGPALLDEGAAVVVDALNGLKLTVSAADDDPDRRPGEK